MFPPGRILNASTDSHKSRHKSTPASEKSFVTKQTKNVTIDAGCDHGGLVTFPWRLVTFSGQRCDLWSHGINLMVLGQLSPHVLIQSMRTSFCIYRLEIRHNTGYNYQIWAIGAGNELSGVILPDGGFHTLALFSLLMTAFAGRNQRFIMECTLLWTIAGYRPQCKVSSKVSKNSV